LVSMLMRYKQKKMGKKRLLKSPLNWRSNVKSVENRKGN
jgi:hypothetical protein